MNPHVSGTTLGVGLDQRPGGKGTRVAGKFGLDPHRLDDEALERELRYLYATREETFFRGTRQALLNHTDRMLQLEHEYASRFPERTRANALRTRKGYRLGAGRPAGRPSRNVEASLVPMPYRRRIVPVGNPPDAPLLAPAIGRVIASTGKVPRAVTADMATARPTSARSWPRWAWPGSPSRAAAASAPLARRFSASAASAGWSSGAPAASARLSCRKHHFGWDRTRMDGLDGARIWCGQGVSARSLVKPRRAAGGQAQQGGMSIRAQGQATTTTRRRNTDRLIAKRSLGASKKRAPLGDFHEPVGPALGDRSRS